MTTAVEVKIRAVGVMMTTVMVAMRKCISSMGSEDQRYRGGEEGTNNNREGEEEDQSDGAEEEDNQNDKERTEKEKKNCLSGE